MTTYEQLLEQLKKIISNEMQSEGWVAIPDSAAAPEMWEIISFKIIAYAAKYLRMTDKEQIEKEIMKVEEQVEKDLKEHWQQEINKNIQKRRMN